MYTIPAIINTQKIIIRHNTMNQYNNHTNKEHISDSTAADIKTSNYSSLSLQLAQYAEKSQKPILYIAENMHVALKQYYECKFYSQLPVLLLPDWETLPYDSLSPHAELCSERLATLYAIPTLEKGIIIAATSTLMHRMIPRNYLEKIAFILQTGDHLKLELFRQKLLSMGYEHLSEVSNSGEFCCKGGIIDIFPMGSKQPYRIELFDNDIETIRTFDPETQLSIEKISHIHLLPATEYPLTADAIKLFRQNWRSKFASDPHQCSIYEDISQAKPSAGTEYYLALFFSELNNITNYISDNTLVIYNKEQLTQKSNDFWKSILKRYQQLCHDVQHPICEPDRCFIQPDELLNIIYQYQHCQFDITATKSDHILQDESWRITSKDFISHITSTIKKYRILFVLNSQAKIESLRLKLLAAHISISQYNTWNDVINSHDAVGIIQEKVYDSMLLENSNMLIITGKTLFGDTQIDQYKSNQDQKNHLHKKNIDPQSIIRDLRELNINSPVVHIQHGIGRYLGLNTITTAQITAEYITIAYADDDKIYVPVNSLHLISRYIGSDAENAPLHKLGNKHWKSTKDKAKKRAYDVAAELLDIYSKRHSKPALAFHKPQGDFVKFKESFPFEETEDQKNAIASIIADMTSEKAMDRVICGDVGFGKTEVAMQASFLATENNKQVIVLVPTTLLCQQHTMNFQDRFANWPIRIESISRFNTAKQTKQIIENISNGKIDIIIGTHRLLSADIKFNSLGLIIVDEEHRFGVRHKEQLKKMRSEVDILTLTATPIPRTLNMALSGMRDLSLITTPPSRRLAIMTSVREYNPTIIKEAIEREILRGGQVYYLHNNVSTIEKTTVNISKWFPEIKIRFAHGQMKESELEKIMTAFHQREFDLLVCTTIIESGIDIPHANTIIIDRADKFGLAQLHQIRGRVGRSHHQAYAYLLHPAGTSLNKDAKKRLDAITNLSDLGSGFQLASYDLEIRGAGNLLGEEQSGEIQSIGFTLYMDMLNEAIQQLKISTNNTSETPATHSHSLRAEIELGISNLFPQDYIPDAGIRLNLYKRLSQCSDKHEIVSLKHEIIDRFGTCPQQALNLFKIAELQILISHLGIKKLRMGRDYLTCDISAKSKIDPSKLVTLLQKKPDSFKLRGSSTLLIKIDKKPHDSDTELCHIIEKNLVELTSQ